MMNLIQVQEQIKGLPVQVLMAYANGMNPQVPPYLALGELNRRKQMEAQAAGAQANAQGPQPTVAQSVQQSMAPQMMAQGPAAQAGGQGVAALPTASDMFTERAFAGGGVVAFASGGVNDIPAGYDVPRYNIPVPTPAENVELTEEQKRLQKEIVESVLRRAANNPGSAGVVSTGVPGILDLFQRPTTRGRSPSAPAASSVPDVNPAFLDPSRAKDVVPPTAVPERLDSGRTAADPRRLDAPRAPTPRPAAAAGTGIAALAAAKDPNDPRNEPESETEKAANKAVMDFLNSSAPVADDPEKVRARMAQTLPILNQPFAEGARSDLQKLKAMYEEQQKSRAKDDFRTFLQGIALNAGGRKGGAALAYGSAALTDKQKADKAADLAFQEKAASVQHNLYMAELAKAEGRVNDYYKHLADAANDQRDLMKTKGQVGATVSNTAEQVKQRKQAAYDNRKTREQLAAQATQARKDALDARASDKADAADAKSADRAAQTEAQQQRSATELAQKDLALYMKTPRGVMLEQDLDAQTRWLENRYRQIRNMWGASRGTMPAQPAPASAPGWSIQLSK